jgi:Zn-dependent peptidase ImmA (M78 family)/DNA-binding XRE family transcriptional regulator
MKASVKPALLRWARERASLTEDALAKRLSVSRDRVEAWEHDGSLTFHQLENLAHSTYTPLGYLFLPEPPVEKLPIPDFRTLGSQRLRQPSPNLLEIIHQCQRRQDWYREYLITNEAQPLPFVGTASPGTPVTVVASAIRNTVKIDAQMRARAATWEYALREMFDLVEEAGILVMRNGVVGNNNKRKLSVQEFRGFALCDEYAPLIFINADDTKAAQMFTLAHELGHIWIGQSGVSDASATLIDDHGTESYCNALAAEVLVPLAEFQAAWRSGADPLVEMRRLSGRFKVSTLVILRRARDAGFLTSESFQLAYDEEAQKLATLTRASGGDFYRTQTSRLGHRFPRAIVESTLEGRTSYRDAFRLLGFSKIETFREFAKSLNIRA